MKYEFRTTVGKLCCQSDHRSHLCPECRAAADEADTGDYTEPPKPYDLALARRRSKGGQAGAGEIVRDADGLPLAYSTALQRRAARGGAR